MSADTETFQHYQVLKREDGNLWELGRGAMGVTYKAFDTNLRSYVALKVINATYLHSETAKARFLREARAAAALSHPNVASVYHLGNDEHSFFYAMEFIDGETLEAFVKRRGALPAPLALGVALQVARALRAAHRIGLVHRDIKPANLMLLRQDEDDADEERLLKVIDFGLAKTSRQGGTDAGEVSATLTIAGFVGTPHFASPEQLEEKEIDTRSDIYSLGATLWYLLSGKPPFSGSLVQIMSQHLSRTPAFDTLTQAGVPEPAVALLRRMLQKDPADRPQTPGDLRRDIEAALRALGGVGGLTTAAAVPGGATTREHGEAATVTNLIPGKEPETAGAPITTHPPGTAFVTVPPPVPGVVLAGRYRLLRSLPDIGARGHLFQALDLVRQHAVALKILHPELLSSEETFARAREAITQTQAEGAAHPVLIAVHDLVRADGHTLLITDWIDGLSLLEVLRHRGRLPRAEVFSLLDPLAAAADHAREHALPGLDFNLGQVMLGFDIAAVPVPPDTDTRAALVMAPLTEWPSFLPRVSPLTLQPESGVLSTWAGGRTLVPSAAAPRLPAAGSFAAAAAQAAAAGALGPADYPAGENDGTASSYLRQLARLAYELLGGGTLPADASAVASFRCPPLAALSERGNAVLRSALAPIGSGGATGAFPSVANFVHELRDAAADFEPGKLPTISLAATAPPPPPPRALAPPRPPAAIPPPVGSSFETSTPPPPVVPSPPVPAREFHRPEKGGFPALLGIAALLLVICGVGVAGYFGWRAWQRAQDPGVVNGGSGEATPSATPSPTVGLAQETPTPSKRLPTPAPSPTATVVFASPTPGPTVTLPVETPPPPPTREEIYRKGAAEAQRLASNGDTAGALESYLELAQNFPDRDTDRSGLDGVVNDLRAKFPPGNEASARRVRQLRADLEKAVALGSESAAVYLGDSLMDDEPRSAAEFYRQAAERGQPRAMIALGNLYFRGRGVPYDPVQVGYWYQKASERGSGLAKVLLAECYRDGKGGMKRDPTRAFNLLNEALAIEPNNALAIGELAGCYDKGLGTAPDPRRAFELYKKASDLGNLNALSNLGVFYINGTGMGKADPRRAVELLRQGAEKDNAQCMFNLAKCLEAGLGTTGGPNPTEARRWYRAAAERGFQPAVEWCQRSGVSFTPKG